MRTAIDIRVTGTVQGVGFRPFVYGLASELGIAGRVLNAGDGVRVHAEGEQETLERFVKQLRSKAPAPARIELIEVFNTADEGFNGFEIASSNLGVGGRTHVSPDLATCPRCLAELLDPFDRRYHYPFINCTNCGPRFTVIEGLPYDRPLTSMAEFEMCPACAAEYANPCDRRFHAQPDACFSCGPELSFVPADTASRERIERGLLASSHLLDPGLLKRARTGRIASYVFARGGGGVEARREASDAALAAAVAVVEGGGIVAVKGLGGYHLVCDACNEEAVRRLRERKHRPDKPLAIMVRDVKMACRYCLVDDEEARLLESPAAPIVLLRRRSTAGYPSEGAAGQPALAEGIAPHLAEIGVMLPATPVQHLLVRALGRPLVMTSGNVTEEPIALSVDEAHSRLAGIADAFLDNNRRITARYDDSVVRVVKGRTMMVRRARGFAPAPIAFPDFGRAVPPIFGAGSELKATFALVDGGEAFVSQHIGDMGNADVFEAWEDARASYGRLFGVEPQVVAHDLHPDYRATRWTLSSPATAGLERLAVQHHHAHISSVIGEHCAARPELDPFGDVIGVALDGTGLGSDGTVWGCEILVCNAVSYERAAHLAPFPLIGGDQATRHPLRIAFGLLRSCGLLSHPSARLRLAELGEEALSVLEAMAARGAGCVQTSSAGRLFDAVAALTGICTEPSYDGQAPSELEAVMGNAWDGLAPLDDGTRRYEMPIVAHDGGTPLIIDPSPMFRTLLDDLEAGVPASEISAAFHLSFARSIVDACVAVRDRTGIGRVALSGGVLMNRHIAQWLPAFLERAGFEVLLNIDLPSNDGCISYGQAVVAAARLAQ